MEYNGCLMLDVNIKNWKSLLTTYINSSDLSEDGYELNPHITVIYGLADNINSDKLKSFISKISKIKFDIIGLSKFNNDEFSVIKLDVESKQLNELNRILANNFDCKFSFPDYHAHITLAYIKPEHSESYKDFVLEKPIKSNSNKFRYNVNYENIWTLPE